MATVSKEHKWAFSGRTAGRLIQGSKSGKSEHNKMRRKIQLKPSGLNRFPRGYKYTTYDGKPVPL